ncbi:thioredoxin family protein [Paenibacillus turpanensis]|uniref:thioredoxin family protein n=1 Tax=Paenibacillus turpanensis TaxID=2689078 RepID=UPI001FB606FB|nr:thioredoxin family protein [Paenibacillus turpanensis]
MEEWNRRAGESRDGLWFLYIYTPMCGTCALAERMLQIALELEPDAPVLKTNIHALTDITAAWQIESVPCLLRLEDGVATKKLYAFQSVPNVVTVLRRWKIREVK